MKVTKSPRYHSLADFGEAVALELDDLKYEWEEAEAISLVAKDMWSEIAADIAHRRYQLARLEAGLPRHIPKDEEADVWQTQESLLAQTGRK